MRRIIIIASVLMLIALGIIIMNNCNHDNTSPRILIGLIGDNESIVDIYNDNVLLMRNGKLVCYNISNKSKKVIRNITENNKQLYKMIDDGIIYLELARGELIITKYTEKGAKIKENKIPYKFWNILSPFVIEEILIIETKEGEALCIDLCSLDYEEIRLYPDYLKTVACCDFEVVGKRLYAYLSDIVVIDDKVKKKYRWIVENKLMNIDNYHEWHVIKCVESSWNVLSSIHMLPNNNEYYIKDVNEDGKTNYHVYDEDKKIYETQNDPGKYISFNDVYLTYRNRYVIIIDKVGNEKIINTCEENISNLSVIEGEFIICDCNTFVYIYGRNGEMCRKEKKANVYKGKYKEYKCGVYYDNIYIYIR